MLATVFLVYSGVQWRRHGGGQAGQLPPTLSGVDFEINANLVRHGGGVAMVDKYCINFAYKHQRGNLHCHSNDDTRPTWKLC